MLRELIQRDDAARLFHQEQSDGNLEMRTIVDFPSLIFELPGEVVEKWGRQWQLINSCLRHISQHPDIIKFKSEQEESTCFFFNHTSGTIVQILLSYSPKSSSKKNRFFVDGISCPSDAKVQEFIKASSEQFASWKTRLPIV